MHPDEQVRESQDEDGLIHPIDDGAERISKGSETGFTWQANPKTGQIALSADPGGTINCWIKLEIPATGARITARTESTPLFVKVGQAVDNREWLEITKSASEDLFDCRSGRTIIVQFDPASTQSGVEDWAVFLNTKGSDSKDWSRRREIVFYASLVLLALAILGAILEALEKYGAQHIEYTSQKCVEQMIESFEGKDEEESNQNRKFLRKLLLEDASVGEALSSLGLNKRQKLALFSRIKEPFRVKMESHIEHLGRLSARLLALQ